MDLLLDVNIILDLCTPRLQWYDQSKKAVDTCRKQGGRLWLYAGSVQTLEYTLRQALTEKFQTESPPLTRRQIALIARLTLSEFARDKNWLAALSREGNVFNADDPEEEQLILALSRFAAGSIKLLTRDQRLLERKPEQTISPENFCRLPYSASQINFIDLKAQQDAVRPKIEKNIHTVLQHGRYILGPEVKELETRLCEYTGAQHCIGVSSGTDALLMPLMAWGIGPGDAVFTTPFTFIATAEVIQILGATPVFVDIDPQTFNLNPSKLALAIKAVQNNDPTIHPLPNSASKLKPKAIIPVDLFGQPADYDPIMALAAKYNLNVLADSAQGFGSVYKGKKSGTLAHATTTSFFPAKPLGCYGDGGAIFTDNDELADILESIRVHGKGRDKYDNIRTGLNARLHTMQAVILLAKLDIFDNELQAKRQLAGRYTDMLGEKAKHLTPPFVPQGLQSAWAQYSILAENSEMRDNIQKSLKKAGIPTMVYYPKPLHMQTAFAGLEYSGKAFSVSTTISERIFSLPMHSYLKIATIEKAADALTSVYKETDLVS